MTPYRVAFTAEAEGDLDGIYDHIATTSGIARADAVVGALVGTCSSLVLFPRRGMPRDDLAPGLRVIAHRRWASIAYTVEGSTVTIEGVFWRGRDLAAISTRRS